MNEKQFEYLSRVARHAELLGKFAELKVAIGKQYAAVVDMRSQLTPDELTECLKFKGGEKNNG